MASDTHDAPYPSDEILPSSEGAAAEDVRRHGDGCDTMPQTIGKYRVLDCVSRTSGEAVIYHAWDPDLQRGVAIKWLRAVLPPAPAVHERLLKEGRLLARVEQPGLARIYDVGIHEQRVYFVLELLKGRNAYDLALETRMTPRRAAEIVARAARAVAPLHAEGLVHRDLKPGNLVIEDDGLVRIIDLGLAVMRDAWGSASGETTGTSGTVQFMAPEQARGEPVGPPADIFALGGVLYFLLTGAAPFSSRDGIARAQARARVCDFDKGALASAHIPAPLARICLKAMAAIPADRFARAEDLALSLERWRRRPRIVAALAGVLGAAAAVAAATWLAGGGSPAPGPLSCERVTDRIERFLPGDDLDLIGALPVRTGDKLKLVWRIPANAKAAVFWFDAEGVATEKAVAVSPEPGGTARVELPDVPGHGVTITGMPGVELIVLCVWAARKPAPSVLQKEFDALMPWPDLPQGAAIDFDQRGIRVLTRGVIEDHEWPQSASLTRGGGDIVPIRSTYREKIDEFRRALVGHLECYSGIAFPHVR